MNDAGGDRRPTMHDPTSFFQPVGKRPDRPVGCSSGVQTEPAAGRRSILVRTCSPMPSTRREITFRACRPAWDADASPAPTCSHLAWEPSPSERELCGNATLPMTRCVLGLWQSCLIGGRCQWKERCNGRPSKEAWVSLLNGNAPNYSANIVAQAFSVKMFSCHRHITLVTPEVSRHTRQWIEASGASTVREVKRIEWMHAPGGVTESYANTFAKLHAWNLTGFSQVVLLDSDTFLLQPQADAIFDHCTDLDADLCAGREDNRGLNSGVMVIRPSEAKFVRLREAVENFHHLNARYMDQNFFNRQYNSVGWKPTDRRGLEFFNIPSRISKGHSAGHSFQSCPKFSRGAFLYKSFRAVATRRRIEAFSIWHHCGVHKLDILPDCPDMTGANSFCVSRVLRLYQWLKKAVDQCSAHGAAASACAAHGRCQWCDDSTRCISKALGCYADDNFTKALASRMLQPRGMSRIRPGWCSTTCGPACCARGRRLPQGNQTKRNRTLVPKHLHEKHTKRNQRTLGPLSLAHLSRLRAV